MGGGPAVVMRAPGKARRRGKAGPVSEIGSGPASGSASFRRNFARRRARSRVPCGPHGRAAAAVRSATSPSTSRDRRSGEPAGGRPRPRRSCSCVYVGLALAYRDAVPLFEAPDEPSHIHYAAFVYNQGRLPRQDPLEVPGEGMQAPLVYVVAAPLLGNAGIDVKAAEGALEQVMTPFYARPQQAAGGARARNSSRTARACSPPTAASSRCACCAARAWCSACSR